MTRLWPSEPEASATEPHWLRKLADALFSTNPPGIDYSSALRTAADEIERLRALVDSQLGDCIGCTTEPDEMCPRDGRSYREWVSIATEVIGEKIELQRDVERFRNALIALAVEDDPEAIARFREQFPQAQTVVVGGHDELEHQRLQRERRDLLAQGVHPGELVPLHDPKDVQVTVNPLASATPIHDVPSTLSTDRAHDLAEDCWCKPTLVAPTRAGFAPVIRHNGDDSFLRGRDA